jgi:hypothetical protein
MNLLAINRCRYYLRVLTTADLCTVAGRKLKPGMWDGSTISHSSPFQWRSTKKPKRSDWDKWQTALSICFNITFQNRLSIQVPLGEWSPSQDGANRPVWRATPDYKWLLNDTPAGWVKHRRLTARSNRHRLASYETSSSPLEATLVQEIVHSAFPASIDHRLHSIDMVDVEDQPLPPAVSPATPTTWEQRARQHDPRATWALEVSTFPIDGGKELAQSLRNGSLRGISDGSFKDEHGTASFSLVGESSTMDGSHVTPGDPRDQSAYRSELSGIYAQVFSAYTLALQFGITDGSMTLGCDGESALYQCFLRPQDVTTSSKHFDMINAIRQLVRQCKFKIIPHHVKGHQDDNPDAILDDWALLNIEMDRRAKEHWASTAGISLGERIQLIYGEPTPIILSGYKVVSHLGACLREHIHGPPLEAYWTKRRTDRDTEIDWKPREAAQRSGSTTRSTWIAKHSTGFCAVQATLYKWNKQEAPLCPICKLEDEDIEHVLKCKNQSTQEHWTSKLAALKTWLTSTTSPAMTKTILSSLRHWLEFTTEPDYVPPDPTLRQAVEDQSRHGWYSFFMGFLSPCWQQYQFNYYQRKGSKKSSKRWTAALIAHLWNTAWDFWKFRNEIVHNNTEGRYAQELSNRIDRLLSLTPDSFPRTKRTLFRKFTKKQLLAKHIACREAWVRTLEAFEGKLSPQESSLARQRRFMTRWMQSMTI